MMIYIVQIGIEVKKLTKEYVDNSITLNEHRIHASFLKFKIVISSFLVNDDKYMCIPIKNTAKEIGAAIIM